MICVLCSWWRTGLVVVVVVADWIRCHGEVIYKLGRELKLSWHLQRPRGGLRCTPAAALRALTKGCGHDASPGYLSCMQ